MRKIICFFMITAAIAAASCSKTEVSYESDGITTLKEVTGFTGDARYISKTERQVDGSIYWKPGDKICVFPYGVTNPGEFTSTNKQAAASTTFTGEMTIRTTVGANDESVVEMNNYALYPYNSTFTRSGEIISASVPYSQNAVASSFDPQSFVSVGSSDNFNFRFYNLCGGLKFSLVNSGIKKVTIKGKNNEILAGRIDISVDNDGYPYVSDVIEPVYEVTLSADRNESFEPGVYYHISTLPVEFSEGFTVTLEKENTSSTVDIESASSISRSTFLLAEELDSDVEFIVEENPAVQAFFASDRHANRNNNGQSIVTPILNYMRNTLGANISHAFLIGDMVGYGNVGSSTYSPAYNTSVVRNEVVSSYPDIPVDIIYGNHDAGYRDDAGIMHKTACGMDCGEYVVYMVPQPYLMETDETKAGANDFKSWARQQDPSKPIFVLSHLPLHAKRGDNLGANYWHKALNEIATGSVTGTTPVRNVIFILGHNHSQDGGTEFTVTKGSTLDIQSFTTTTVKKNIWGKSGGSKTTTSATTLAKQKIYYDYFVGGYLNDRGHGSLMTLDNTTISLQRYSKNGPVTSFVNSSDGPHTLVINRIATGNN